MTELFSKLSEPFPSEAIDWRVGATNSDKNKGIALAYIQARPVMDRLDEVVGLENWTDVYTPNSRQRRRGWLSLHALTQNR